jgi:hypothetical protein
MKIIENEGNIKIKYFNTEIFFKYQEFTSNIIKD